MYTWIRKRICLKCISDAFRLALRIFHYTYYVYFQRNQNNKKLVKREQGRFFYDDVGTGGLYVPTH